MAGLAEAMQGAVGQPASVRIGVVDSTSPLVISAQAAPFDDVGLLEGYIPQVGDSVALLGQSSGAGSDPASWLALGSIQASTAPLAVSVTDVFIGTIATDSTTYIPTVVLCSTPFVAPNSGRVLVLWRAEIWTAGGVSTAHAAPQINDASGATVSAAVDSRAISTPFEPPLNIGSHSLIEAGLLTPGVTYTAVLMHRTSNAASPAFFTNREITVVPVP